MSVDCAWVSDSVKQILIISPPRFVFATAAALPELHGARTWGNYNGIMDGSWADPGRTIYNPTRIGQLKCKQTFQRTGHHAAQYTTLGELAALHDVRYRPLMGREDRAIASIPSAARSPTQAGFRLQPIS